MLIEGVHHVAIICANYDISKKFYTETLKLPIINETFRKERDSIKLDLQVPGGVQIELFSFPDAPNRPSYPEAQGLRHLAFKVSDIEEAVKKLKEKGIEVEAIRVDEMTGKSFTFFQDPDGLPLELYEI
ncbi:MAG: VOC family protein [Bacillaceae bacterium]|nr:VOC family protein [Bacillaceae bacterium]